MLGVRERLRRGEEEEEEEEGGEGRVVGSMNEEHDDSKQKL